MEEVQQHTFIGFLLPSLPLLPELTSPIQDYLYPHSQLRFCFGGNPTIMETIMVSWLPRSPLLTVDRAGAFFPLPQFYPSTKFLYFQALPDLYTQRRLLFSLSLHCTLSFVLAFLPQPRSEAPS